MKKRLFLFFIMISCVFSVKAQEMNSSIISQSHDTCLINISIPFPVLFFQHVVINETYTLAIMDSCYNTRDQNCAKVSIQFKDCFGSSEFKIISAKGTVLQSGSYCGKDMVQNTYVNVFDDEGNPAGRRLLFWYSPSKCGIWQYYDVKGIVRREERYSP